MHKINVGPFLHLPNVLVYVSWLASVTLLLPPLLTAQECRKAFLASGEPLIAHPMLARKLSRCGKQCVPTLERAFSVMVPHLRKALPRVTSLDFGAFTVVLSMPDNQSVLLALGGSFKAMGSTRSPPRGHTERDPFSVCMA